MGYAALYANTEGTGNVALGYFAGRYKSATTSDKLFIDDRDRTNESGEQTHGLIYGGFAAATASQFLRINANVGIKTHTFGTSADGVLAVATGTAPSTSPADAFQLYSADFAAGNACPYFRTEGGTIIGLNQSLLTTASPSFSGLALSNGGEFQLYDTGSSNYVGFKAPALSANKVWTLPSADGTSSYCLVTDGSGTLSWAENGSGYTGDCVKVTGTSTLTGAVTIAGAYNIDLSSYNMVYVAPGSNTLSDAVTAMSNGDCLILGSGTYTQSVAVTIPTSVKRFAILGAGVGNTIITYTNDTHGIVSQTGNNAYRITTAEIAHFTMKYTEGAQSTTKYGIYLWGEGGESYADQHISIHDINLYGYGDSSAAPGSEFVFWRVGVYLEDCYYADLHNIYIRPSLDYRTGTWSGRAADGIWLYSCMNCNLYGFNIIAAEDAIVLEKAADGQIKSTTKHGTEGTRISTGTISYCDHGIRMGDKAYAITMDSLEIVLTNFHIEETYQVSVGGYHIINACIFDSDSNCTFGTANVKLTMTGTVVSNCSFKGDGSPSCNQHYLYIAGDHTVVTGCKFRNIPNTYAAIYVNDNNYLVINGNHMEGSTGYFIDGTCDYSVINNNLYVHMNGETDRYDVVNANGTKTGNLEV
jgi:hypothetical protein